MAKTALAGLRVIELCGMIAGPYCTKILADLGAEVVKVEEPARGDPARRAGPFPQDSPQPERSGLFLYLNTNKLGVTLDVTGPTGRRLLLELLQDADVLVHDRPPGQAEALGLGYEALAGACPELVVTAVSPFGASGPHRDWRAHHLNLYHASGASSFLYVDPRQAEKGPVVGGGSVGEYDGGLAAAVATLGAVLGRARTGRGQQVEVSKQEALLALERVEIGTIANILAPAGPQDPSVPAMAAAMLAPSTPPGAPTPPGRPGMVGGLVRSRDGHVVITAAQDHQWKALVEAMGNPDWAQAEFCRNELGRSEHRDEIQDRLEAWAAEHTSEEMYHTTQGTGTPVGPVRTVAEVMAWPQARERGFFVEVEHPEAGRLEYPGAAYRCSETPWRLERPAPCHGQHNEAVYCERLGHSRRDLARLRAAGVI